MPKQRRIALKIYEWVEKGLYFHKRTKKKKSKKIVLSTLEPRTANLCFSLFSHSGSHILAPVNNFITAVCIRLTLPCIVTSIIYTLQRQKG